MHSFYISGERERDIYIYITFTEIDTKIDIDVDIDIDIDPKAVQDPQAPLSLRPLHPSLHLLRHAGGLVLRHQGLGHAREPGAGSPRCLLGTLLQLFWGLHGGLCYQYR